MAKKYAENSKALEKLYLSSMGLHEVYAPWHSIADIQPLSKPLRPDHKYFVAMTENQARSIPYWLGKAFPYDTEFQKVVLKLARHFDKKVAGELIGNLKRLCNEVSPSQLEQLHRFLNDGRFSAHYGRFFRDPEVWTDKKKASEALDALFEEERKLNREYLTEFEMQSLDRLYRRALGRSIFDDLGKEAFTLIPRSSVQTLKDSLLESIKIDERLSVDREAEGISLEDIRSEWIAESLEDGSENFYDGFSLADLVYDPFNGADTLLGK